MHKTANIYHLYFLRFVKILIATILVLSMIGLSAAILSMLFGKPIGDDYGGIATYRSGNWLQETYHSLETAGRYGQSIAGSILYGVLRNKIVIILPLLVTCWFIFLCFFYIKKFLRLHIKDRQLLNIYSLTSSVILTFLVLFINNAPLTNNLTGWVSYQLFFWPSGIITYTLPLLIFLTGAYLLFFSNLSSKISKHTQVIAYVVFLIVSSLFNEVQPAILLTVSAGLLIASYIKPFRQIKKYRYITLTTIVATVIGLIALYFSPGRIQRSQVLDTIVPSTNGSLIGSIIRNLDTLTHGLYLKPRELLLLILIGVLGAIITYLMANNKRLYESYIRQMLPYAFALIVVCFISIIISVALIVVGYGYSAGIYPRTMLIPQLTYVVSILFLFFSLSSLIFCKFGINNIFKTVVVFLGIAYLISIPNYTSKILTQINSSVTYSNAWVEQNAILQKAASNNVKETVYLTNPATGIGDGFSLQCAGPYAKTTMWLNVQISEYYGHQDRICPSKDKDADLSANQDWINQ